MADYLQHARRHRSQGSDPIPGVGSAAWAMLDGIVFNVDGSDTATLPAGSSGICRWDHFVTGGDLSVFATHNNFNFPGGGVGPIPPPSDFNNSSGDDWVYAVKTGILLANFDVNFESADGSSFPLQVRRNDGVSSYQSGEPFGPQAWITATSGTSSGFSWWWIRPIDNEPTRSPDELYYEFQIVVQNLDSSDHTLDSQLNFELALAWIPVEPGSLNVYY